MNEERKYAKVLGGHIHRYPAFETCNIDDASEREYIGEQEALEAGAKSPDRMCGHCFPPLPVIHDVNVSTD